MRTSPQLNTAREDYIRAIYLLSERGEAPGVTDVATKLKLSKSTVSERVRGLEEDGLVTALPYAAIVLTKKGSDVGRKLTYKHRITEVFLSEILKVPKDRVHAEAERLEHALSDDVIKRIAKLLKHPKTDPHGSVIPTIKNWNC